MEQILQLIGKLLRKKRYECDTSSLFYVCVSETIGKNKLYIDGSTDAAEVSLLNIQVRLK